MSEKNNSQRTMPRSQGIVAPVTRPPVGPARRQYVIILMDTSPSMEGNNKMGDANTALIALTKVLGDEKTNGAFEATIAAYGASVKMIVTNKPAASITPEDQRLTVGMAGDDTNITLALQKGLELVENAPTGDPWQRPVVVLMSDGNHCSGLPEPETVAPTLKTKADLICVAFGPDADFLRLEKLATSPDHAVRCTDGAALRRFFISIGTSMSIAARTGQALTSLLGQSKGVVRKG